MKKIFVLLTIMLTTISCKQEPKVKDELKSIFEKYARFTDNPYIDVENSNIHNGKLPHHLLMHYKFEENGVELEIAQNDIDGLEGLTNVSDNDKIFITFSSIQNVYVQSNWNKFDTKREKIIIVLNK